MKNKLKLKATNPDQYVVASLPDGTMFVHDKESGENFFNQKTIMELTGLTQQAVSKHIKRYKAISTNTTISCISLEVFNSNRPVDFHSFNALTYVAYRSNKPRLLKDLKTEDETFNDVLTRILKENGYII